MFRDGAMGTMLQKAGLRPGEIPELMNLKNPGAVREIQAAYVDAGSRVIYANTFGANALKLKKTPYTVRDVVLSGVRIARDAM